MRLHEVQEGSCRSAGEALRRAWPPEHAMTGDELEAFFDELRYCVLATATGKGRPQARPVAFIVFDDALWFGTGAGGRLKNVERTPWVSAVVSDRDGEAHRAAVAEGPVVISDSPPHGLLEQWEKRFGTRPDWATHWLELRPERLFSYAAPARRAS